MTRPRREQICLESTPYYYCVSRCVHRAFLCGIDVYSNQSYEHRRQWVKDRIRQLANVFAIDVCAYAVMSNHHHLVAKIDRERCLAWPDGEVIDRWYGLFNGHQLVERLRSGESLSQAERDAALRLANTWRNRLMNLSWYMRCLNEHIARLANEEDKRNGRFWEGRYQSRALLDEKALISCMRYVNSNPIHVPLATTPEASDFTSIQADCGDSITGNPPRQCIP